MRTGTTANWTSGTGAIDDPERQPYTKVLVDLPGTTYDDISDDVLSVQYRMGYEDSYTGYVPSGAVSGDLDVELASGSKYSPLNVNSPFYGSSIINCNATADVGFTVDGTGQYLQQFAGLTSKWEVRSADRQTALSCKDMSERLRRTSITWPLMTDVPSDYIIRAALAEAGISDGQTDDNECVFHAHFDGTQAVNDTHGIIPIITLIDAGSFLQTDGRKYGTAFVYGKISGSVGTVHMRYNSNYYLPNGCIAGWVRVGTNTRTDFQLCPTSTGLEIIVDQTQTGTERISFSRNDNVFGSRYTALGTDITTRLLHVAASWDSSIGQIDCYIDGSLFNSGTLDETTFGDFAYVDIFLSTMGTRGPQPVIDHLTMYNNYRTAADIHEMFSASSADDDETDIDVGMNTVDYLWIRERDAWNLIKDVCKAEGASFFFDADGKAHFENRYHRLNPPYDESQKSIGYDGDMLNVSVVKDVDSVINRAVVKANPLVIGGSQDIWNSDSLISVPRNSTRELWAAMGDPIYSADTSFSGGTLVGQSRYSVARKYSTGSYGAYPGSLVVRGTLYSDSMRLVATNLATDRTLYFADASGNPDLKIWGVPLKRSDSLGTQAGQLYSVATDETSMETYGTHSIEIDSEFVTSPDYADWLSQYLVLQYAEPNVRLEGVEIMGDPRLEVGDRIHVTDSGESTGVDDDCWIMGMDSRVTPGYTQSLTLDRVPDVQFLIYNKGSYNDNKHYAF